MSLYLGIYKVLCIIYQSSVKHRQTVHHTFHHPEIKKHGKLSKNHNYNVLLKHDAINWTTKKVGSGNYMTISEETRYLCQPHCLVSRSEWEASFSTQIVKMFNAK